MVFGCAGWNRLDERDDLGEKGKKWWMGKKWWGRRQYVVGEKCTGLFYMHYTILMTKGFLLYLKDKAILVKRLAQGLECQDQDWNPHPVDETHQGIMARP